MYFLELLNYKIVMKKNKIIMIFFYSDREKQKESLETKRNLNFSCKFKIPGNGRECKI